MNLWMQNLPPVFATAGLHGSASTWVFNVARELLLAELGDGLLAVYAETPDELPPAPARAGRRLLVKSHHGSAALDAWLAEVAAPLLLSVRDPRDACVSMAQRFGLPPGQWAPSIARDCARLARLAPGRTVLRYEARFFDTIAGVAEVARMLGIAAAPEAQAAIFARYRTEAVRDFASRLDDLPEDRVITTPSTKLDRTTQIHATHIGDGRTGKWRDLPATLRAEMTKLFAPFLEQFGYPLD
jgi:hypothetical protein